MKRLFALLLLAVAPAFAQEYTPGPYIPQSPPTGETENIIYTTLNPPPPGTNFTWTGFINLNTGGGGLSGGNIPAYNGQTGTFIFGYAQGTVDYNLFGSSELPSKGNLIDSFKYSWEYFNQEFSRGTLTANIRFYDPNNNILEAHNFQLGQTTNGWTLFGGEINFDNPYDMSEIGRIQISFTGKDDRFWAGYYGPQVRALDLSLTYGTAPPPTDFLYWKRLAGENELFTLTERGVVRYGADGVYIYQEFEAGTYACTNGDWGSDPIGGVVKSCEFGSNIAPPVAEVNCVTDPTDPSCIIDSITNDAVDETMLADTGFDSGSDDGSDAFTEDEEPAVDPVAEEVFVAEEIASEEVVEENIEELLADEEATDEEEEATAVETVVVAKTLENEEKASVLSDSISKDVLEAALSVAADATAAGSVAGESTSTVASSSASTRSASETSETAVAEVSSSSETTSEEIAVASNEGDASAELLETGRVLGQEALAVTLAGTEASANESVAEAESVSAAAAETSMVAADSSITTTQSEEVVVAEETQTQESSVVVAEVSETTTEAVVAETIVQAETSAEMSFDVGKEMMAENAQQMATAEDQEAEALNIVAAAAASSEQKFDDESAKDAETTNALVDPALAMANTFNQPPSMMNLEIIGVLKPIEKSDAEVRAEQVVAANKEQQDAINANYMDADQSGIVAAIGAEADVSSYLSQRLTDVPFYKPEDIYKNIVIKDNVRGSYFLEKGNTDTYKRMVEEQYKDE